MEDNVSNDKASHQHTYTAHDADSITWWSWRPGIHPRKAIFLGGLISLLALLLGSIGFVTLVLSIMDSFSAPFQLPGVVSSHIVNNLDGFPRLSIRLHAVSFPATISPVVSQAAFHAIHDGTSILVDYSPRLHFLYALDSAGQYYLLPGTSKADNPIGSLALLLLGIALFPYPALLTLWGWRDLHADYSVMTANVVGKRAALHTTTRNRPGLTPRLARSWYGLALDSVDPTFSQQLTTFSVSYETYCAVEKGALVQITYSPHLYYVHTIKRLANCNLLSKKT
jgi:hypothetical protein